MPQLRLFRISPAALAPALLALAPAAPLAAQDSVTVVAGPEYRAGPLKRRLLGTEYRDLWTAPVRVPVLDLGTFAGGLTPTEPGGGNQTVSLRFRGADGVEYAFRSVNKRQGRGAHPDLRGTLVTEILQDQVSSLNPAGPIVADALAESAGLLHIPPRLYVMPDDPRLGQFRQEFAGMLGMVEERPDEGATRIPELARADEIAGSADFFEALYGGAADRLAVDEYLRARLLDLVFGDWDRHGDQYRWARFDSAGLRVWRPVPRDRDYVFVDYDGWLIDLVRSRAPNAVRFVPEYRGQLRGLIQSAEPLDRRFLPALPRETWEAVARDLAARLSDAAIDRAVRRLPPEYYALEADDLARTLRMRRDRLAQAAMALYDLYAREPEVHAKDVDDRAEVERLPDGSVEVRLWAPGVEGGPYFARRFAAAETREVRLYLNGGNDRARVYGAGPETVVVRVVGGAGDDTLTDETRSGRRTAFYDDDGDDRFSPRPGTTVDRGEWEEAVYDPEEPGPRPRDWGRVSAWTSPTVGWHGQAGPFVGVGPTRTRWGFRRFPYARTEALRVLYAPLHSRFGLEYTGDFRYVGSQDRLTVVARASAMEGTAFYGYGNDTPDRDHGDVIVWERQLLAEPTFTWVPSTGTAISLGPSLRWTDPSVEAGTPAVFAGPGSDDFATAGARGRVHLRRAGETTFPTRGWTADVSAGAHAPLSGGDGAFATTRAVGTAYLPLSPGPVVAVRAGGERVWGDAPFQYAAFVGGLATVRGYRLQRFAGDAAAWGSVELRQPITRAELVVKGTLGVIALADAGRVWFDGESEGDWHTSTGGGAFFTFLDRRYTVSATYAYGERGIIYIALGAPF